MPMPLRRAGTKRVRSRYTISCLSPIQRVKSRGRASPKSSSPNHTTGRPSSPRKRHSRAIKRTESLGQLRQDAALAGDAKADAQVLAHQLRETLGESALFPEEAEVKERVVKKRRIVRRPLAAAQRSAEKPAEGAAALARSTPTHSTAPVQAAKSGGASDPFSALR
jgi:hypothetical protein